MNIKGCKTLIMYKMSWPPPPTTMLGQESGSCLVLLGSSKAGHKAWHRSGTLSMSVVQNQRNAIRTNIRVMADYRFPNCCS